MGKSLYVRVLIGVALGAVLGAAWPDAGAAVELLATAFIKLVKMTIAPLIFCTVVTGIASAASLRAVGKVGGLALVYFEVASTLALLIGLVVINVVAPGSGIHAHPSAADAAAVGSYAGHELSARELVLDAIPDAMIGALARGDLLPVLVVAVLFGAALQRSGERGASVRDLIDRAGHVVFEVVAIVMQVAPVAAFGAIAATVGKYGAGALASLGELMACFYLTCLVFVLGVLGTVARVHGFSIVRYLRYIADELAIVLATSSSESVLPRMMAKLEAAGASRPVVGVVIPAGYSFNLDGTAIYLTMAAVFVAQATDHPLGIASQLELLAVLLLTSKGAAGVTGSGFIVLAATLGQIGDIPVAGVALILGIDRFMSEARALTNVIGNGVATLVVARWCGALDREQLHAALAPAVTPRPRRTP